ncbi:MAG: DUF342 domain-containing protein [Planctomycetes bacterium]|nr:DUF342 domain-containing protein [Planctomycetota bacterium]
MADPVAVSAPAAPRYDPGSHKLLRQLVSGGKRLLVYALQDETAAWLTLEVTGSAMLGPGEVEQVVRDSGVPVEPERAQAARLHIGREFATGSSSPGRACEPFLLAQGQPSLPGDDGRVEWALRVPGEHEISLTEDDRGRVDFRELGRVANVNTGQALARVIEPTQGKPGRTIFGRPLPAKSGRRAPLGAGPNVEVDAAGTFRARIDGHVFLRGVALCVEPVYHVRGHVDLGVGNLDVAGTIHCHRDVGDGFTLRAREHILVEGLVLDSVLVAGGDIEVGGGITFRDAGRLRVGGRLFARHLVNVRADVADAVWVQSQIVNCRISAGGRIHCEHGQIVGGSVTALGGIVVRHLGAEAGTRTIVRVSADTFETEETRALTLQIAELEGALNRIETRLGPFIEDHALVEALAPDKQAAVLALLEQAGQYRTRMQQTVRARDAALARYAMHMHEEIIVNGMLHAGADVGIDGCRRVFTESVRGPLRLQPDYSRGDVRVVTL